MKMKKTMTMQEVDVAVEKRNAEESNVKKRVWMTKIWIS